VPNNIDISNDNDDDEEEEEEEEEEDLSSVPVESEEANYMC
jgi:hypothetical protein